MSGRMFETPEGDATRPSMDAHRLSVMNRLGQDLSGERVLDLFAGSGAFAFECLSRGAASAVLNELAKDAAALVRRNAKTLGCADRAFVVQGDAYGPPADVVRRAPFDIVFFAPPYSHFKERAADVARCLGALRPLLADGAVVIVQSDLGDFPSIPDGYGEEARRAMGRTEFVFLGPA